MKINEYKKEIVDYFKLKKEVQSHLLSFLENTDDVEIDFNYLINFLNDSKITNKQEELEHFLRLLLNIANNHYRNADFLANIERILQFYSNDIKQTYSNFEIFNFFFSNKLILLFLFEKQIITIEDSIINQIFEEGKNKKIRYCHFFLPELKKSVEKEKIKKLKDEIVDIEATNLTDYDKKRLIGENTSKISSLIRNDSIDEFVSYTTKQNIPLSSKIKQSIFETNSFLIDKNPSLIEYAAFFGSLQIFNYLRLNNVELSPVLWLYAIHGKNAIIIHLLEEYNLEYNADCFIESIKCHHNDIANYFQNVIQQNQYNNDFLSSIYFEYCNYSFFPKKFDKSYIFFYLCKYNYFEIVKIFFKIKKHKIKKAKVLN